MILYNYNKCNEERVKLLLPTEMSATIIFPRSDSIRTGTCHDFLL